MTRVRGSVAAEARLGWLTEHLRAHGSVTIAEAAAELGVSEMTIRRDLDELEGRGTIRRVRGGATLIGPQTVARRREAAARAKGRIAAKLAPLVPERGAVAFDASTTIMRLATGLDGAADLTVVTNGPDTFATLQQVPGVTALLSGGWLDPRTGSLVGPLACRSVTQLGVEALFLSAAAVDPTSGAMEATLEEAEVKRAIASVARRVVLAVDASKLDTRSMAVGVGWDDVDLLVTELDPSDARLDPFRDRVELA